MSEERENRAQVRPRGYGFIPAGTLIGLGAGILLGYPVPGVLVGLGAGFFASSVVSHAFRRGRLPFSGIIFIIIGLWFFIYPSSPGYVAAIAVIVLGLLFLIRGLWRKKSRGY